MCIGGFKLKPTTRTVYVQKKSAAAKAKVVKAPAAAPVIIRANSSDSSSEGPRNYQYVVSPKASGNKQNDKQKNCACVNCGNGPGGAKKLGPKEARIIVRGDPRKRCVCNGRGKGRWFCDACRAAQKKTKGTIKVLTAPSTSDGRSCCCGGCGSEDTQARFEREVDEWMKESKQKMKERNAKLVCNCLSNGCKVCVIVRR